MRRLFHLLFGPWTNQAFVCLYFTNPNKLAFRQRIQGRAARETINRAYDLARKLKEHHNGAFRIVVKFQEN